MKTTLKRKVAATLAALSLLTVGSAAMASGAHAEAAAPISAQTYLLVGTASDESDAILKELGKDILDASQKTVDAAKKDDSKLDLLVDTAKNMAPVVGDVLKYTGQKIVDGAKSAWNWFTGLF